MSGTDFNLKYVNILMKLRNRILSNHLHQEVENYSDWSAGPVLCEVFTTKVTANQIINTSKPLFTRQEKSREKCGEIKIIFIS